MGTGIYSKKNMKGIKPLRGYILVKPIEVDEKTAGGLYKPDSSNEKQGKGKVIAVGYIPIEYEKLFLEYGAPTWKPEIKAGDVIAYKQWSQDEIKENGKTYVFVSFTNLLGKYD